MARALAVDADRAVTADRSKGYAGGRQAYRSRRQGEQLVKAAAVGGQLSHLLPVNDVALFATVGLHGDRVGFNGHLLCHAADDQLEIDTCAISDGEHEVFLLGGLETGRGRAHVVMPDLQVRSHVLAIAVGRQAAGNPGINVGDRDGGVGDGRARRVGHGADDSRFLRQSGKGEHHEKGCEEKSQTGNAAPDSLTKTPDKHGREGFHWKPPNQLGRKC